MTTVAEFDFDDACNRLLDALAEIVRATEDLTVAVLTVETNDHRQARQLLREMVATLTDREFTSSVHKEWIRAAQQLVGPVDDPLSTAAVRTENCADCGQPWTAHRRGGECPPNPDGPILPTIQRDDE